MKKLQLLIFFLIAAISLGSFSSCRFHCIRGSGHQITENRKPGDYTKIDVSESFKVIVKQDSSNTVTVTADDNLLKYIRTSVTGGTLRIYTKKNMCNSGEMIIKVPVRMLEGLKASDVAEIVSDGKLNGKDVYLHVSDGSRITADVTATKVFIHSSDASVLELKGQASSSESELSDGSKVYAKDFVAGSAWVRSSDGSYGEFNVLNTLNVHGSDGSVIKYHGNPQTVNANNSDGASVEKVN